MDKYNPKGFKVGDVITPRAGAIFEHGITYGSLYTLTGVVDGLKFVDDDGRPRDRGDGCNFDLVVSVKNEEDVLTVEQLKKLEKGDKLYVVDAGLEKKGLNGKEVIVIGTYNREAGDFGFDVSFDGDAYFNNTIPSSKLESFKAKRVTANKKSMPSQQATTAPDFLQAALGHMKERAITYDNPQGERSMKATVEAFKAITGISLTEETGWMFMLLLKLVRSQQGAYKSDSYEDASAYAALMGEAANKARNNV